MLDSRTRSIRDSTKSKTAQNVKGDFWGVDRDGKSCIALEIELGDGKWDSSAYDLQCFAHHKHHVGVDDHLRVLD